MCPSASSLQWLCGHIVAMASQWRKGSMLEQQQQRNSGKWKKIKYYNDVKTKEKLAEIKA